MIGRDIFSFKYLKSLNIRPPCQVRRKAMSMSRIMDAVSSQLFRLTLILSIRLVSYYLLERSILKPNCLGLIVSTSDLGDSSSIRFFSTFDINNRNGMGFQFAVFLGCLPGFGRVMIIAIFHGDGKWQNLRQPLIILIWSSVMCHNFRQKFKDRVGDLVFTV